LIKDDFAGFSKKNGDINKKVTGLSVDPPKFKIRSDFGQLQTLTANIAGADRHTKNQ